MYSAKIRHENLPAIRKKSSAEKSPTPGANICRK